jgi:type II secretory pathway component GspD/PulD (secretin)
MQMYRNGMCARAAGLGAAMLLLGPALALAAQGASAQTPARSEDYICRTIYLKHVSGQNSLNDIQTALRSVVRRSIFYGIASQNAIEFRGTPEDFETAQSVVANLDKPQRTYRLTYTITDANGGKTGGPHHFSMVAVDGRKAFFKEGTRVPIVTGVQASGTAAESSQVQYVDIGLNIQATIQGAPDSLSLQSLVQQSGVAEGSAQAKDPVIRQAVLDNAATLIPGKPQILGSLDIPGTTRQEQIEVVAEPLP